MGKLIDKSLRDSGIFITVLLMLLSMLVSRAGLSIAMISFLVLACLHQDFFVQIRRFLSNRFLLAVSLLFFIPLISGLWSEDKEQWLRFVRIKLPLLFFPIAYAGDWQFSKKQWTWIARVFILVVLAGTCWSLYHYFQDMQAIHAEYLKAKTMDTPLDNDHIRFSLLVVVGVVTGVYLVFNESSRILQVAAALVSLLLAAYLHILSARTGLMALYLFILIVLVVLLIRSGRKKVMLYIVAGMLILPAVAWFAFPTFQNRVRYMMYDLQHIKAGQYLPGSNDGSRWVSIQAGWNILQENPMGVGAGDVMPETSQWYEKHVPAMTMKNLYPSSEWMMYGCIAGWLGIMVFTLAMIIPFFSDSRDFFFYSVAGMLAFSFLFDIGLEVQFGVFIYVFVLLWWWKMRKEATQ